MESLEIQKRTQSLILWVDILGFSNFIKNMTNEQETKYQSIVSNFNDILHGNGFQTVESGIIKPNFLYFSDTIVGTFPNSVEMWESNLRALIDYSIQLQTIFFLKLHLLLRGAIHLGEVYHVKNILYGKGIIEAYNLENKKIKTPCILLSKEVCGPSIKQTRIINNKGNTKNYYRNNISFLNGNPYLFNDCPESHIHFLKGLFHINPLNYVDIDNIREIITEELYNHQLINPQAFEKWLWLAKLFNTLASEKSINRIEIPKKHSCWKKIKNFL